MKNLKNFIPRKESFIISNISMWSLEIIEAVELSLFLIAI